MPAEGEETPTDPAARVRGVRRDQGEVHQWPRGLVAYVPAGPPDAGPPPEEEERTAQRLRLATRLIDLLRAHGVSDPSWLGRLQEAERAYRAEERSRASQLIDALLGVLGERADRAHEDERSHRHP